MFAINPLKEAEKKSETKIHHNCSASFPVIFLCRGAMHICIY